MRAPDTPARRSWRDRLHEIIFESDTRAGKLFDLVLLGAILASVILVMIESVRAVRLVYGPQLLRLEWVFTLAFTVSCPSQGRVAAESSVLV